MLFLWSVFPFGFWMNFWTNLATISQLATICHLITSQARDFLLKFQNSEAFFRIKRFFIKSSLSYSSKGFELFVAWGLWLKNQPGNPFISVKIKRLSWPVFSTIFQNFKTKTLKPLIFRFYLKILPGNSSIRTKVNVPINEVAIVQFRIDQFSDGICFVVSKYFYSIVQAEHFEWLIADSEYSSLWLIDECLFRNVSRGQCIYHCHTAVHE